MHNQKKDNNKFKNKNNQNCQKIKLYGSPTTKELKKKHSPRPVGGTDAGSWVERTYGKVVAGGLGDAAAGRADSPTFAAWIDGEEKLRSKMDRATQSPSREK